MENRVKPKSNFNNARKSKEKIMNFKSAINDFVTCEIHYGNRVQCFAKLGNGNWVAVLDNGDLDSVEVCGADLESMLETVEGIGADIRFTNHSAA